MNDEYELKYGIAIFEGKDKVKEIEVSKEEMERLLILWDTLAPSNTGRK